MSIIGVWFTHNLGRKTVHGGLWKNIVLFSVRIISEFLVNPVNFAFINENIEIYFTLKCFFSFSMKFIYVFH